MTGPDDPLIAELRGFLRTIQKPGRPVEGLALDEPLVASGLIDSLATMQIVVHLEQRYSIDFGAAGFDPEQLATLGSIAAMVRRARS